MPPIMAAISIKGDFMNCISHEKITEYAINISGFDFTKKEIDILKLYSTQPDVDETEGAFKNHFYNPSNNLNFRGERTNALTKLDYHFSSSNNGDILEKLGRAIHYLEDLCCPVHVYYEDLFDAVYRSKQHMNFETLCDKIINDINPLMLVIQYDYFTTNSLKTIGKSCAMKASKLFYELDEVIVAPKEIAERSILLAIEAVAGLLYRCFGGKK